jgi:hypothetical protein
LVVARSLPLTPVGSFVYRWMRAARRASAPESSVVSERLVRSTNRSVSRFVRSVPSRLTGLELLS